jgi:hypothetical protein
MARSSTPPVRELAEALVQTMVFINPREWELALVLYRSLAAGEPVSPGSLAEEVRRDPGVTESPLTRVELGVDSTGGRPA